MLPQRIKFWLYLLLVLLGGVFIYQRARIYDALQGHEIELDAAKFTINGIGLQGYKTLDEVIERMGQPSRVGKRSARWGAPNGDTTSIHLAVRFDENHRLQSVVGNSLEYDGQVILKEDDLKERAETLVGQLAPVDIYHTDERGSPLVDELYYNRPLRLELSFVSRKERPFRVALIALVNGGYRHDLHRGFVHEQEPRKYPVFRVPVGTKPTYEHRGPFSE